VKGLAQAMGGDIRYTREGGATTFEVLLPSAEHELSTLHEPQVGNGELHPA
jgi:hypothetical protein